MNPVKALFRGRYRKLKIFAAILFLVAGCVGTLGVLAYTSLVSTAEYAVTGLEVKQKGTGIEVKWDDQNADGYEVFLQTNRQRPHAYPTKKTHCRIELDELGRAYKVTVTARSGANGLSGAASEKINTKKVYQDIQTSEESYDGLPDKSDSLETEAQTEGEITYKSRDTDVVTVDENGIMHYKKAGHTKVIVFAEGDARYRRTRKYINVNVFPDRLEAPSLRVNTDRSNETTAVLTWNKVDFSRGYRLLKLNPSTGKYSVVKEFEGKDTEAKVLRDNAKYKLEAFAEIDGVTIEGIQSKAAEVKSVSATAEGRSSAHNLKTLDFSNLEVVCTVSGSGGATVPQSMSHVGDNYVITYVDHGGTVGALVAYSRDGEPMGINSIKKMGHANGSTYNPNTGKIYTVRTHREIRSNKCATFDPEDGSGEGTFNLPRIASGIAYDETNNKYILSKGNELYVTDKDFKVEKSMRKGIRYNHAQDIGAHNGVALVCTWVAGNESYIDLYRISDKAYLGSYHVPIGEIESCFMDGKHLVILMNNATRAGDCILRTVDPVTLP